MKLKSDIVFISISTKYTYKLKVVKVIQLCLDTFAFGQKLAITEGEIPTIDTKTYTVFRLAYN